MTYTDAVINNSSAKARAKHSEKKQALRIKIYNETGWMPSKSLSIKNMMGAISE